jgi:hypothetical protein
VLRVGERAPRSATDAFALEAARARADAILTTGEILRREPALRHDLGRAARAWRRERLGLATAPRTVVLTRRPPADFAATPLGARPETLFLGSDPPRAGTRAAVVSSAGPIRSLAEALDVASRATGAHSILVEAGPATAGELYAGSLAPDELLLSVYRGPPPPPEALAGPFPRTAELARAFGAPVHVHVEDGANGPWRFERWLRRGAAPTRRADGA